VPHPFTDAEYRQLRVSARLPEFIVCPTCQVRIRVWQWTAWGKGLVEQRSTWHDVQVISTHTDGHVDAFVLRCGDRLTSKGLRWTT
jgi:hypothetical protein